MKSETTNIHPFRSFNSKEFFLPRFGKFIATSTFRIQMREQKEEGFGRANGEKL